MINPFYKTLQNIDRNTTVTFGVSAADVEKDLFKDILLLNSTDRNRQNMK